MRRLAIFCPACESSLQIVLPLVPVRVGCPQCSTVFSVNPSIVAAVSKEGGLTLETAYHHPRPLPPRNADWCRFNKYSLSGCWAQIALNVLGIAIMIGLFGFLKSMLPASSVTTKILAAGCTGGAIPAVCNIVRMWRLRNL